MCPSPYVPAVDRCAQEYPVAPYTWEIQQILARTVLETGRIPMRWNRPVRVIGCYASVLQYDIQGGGLIVPTVDEIQVLIGSNQQDRFTARLEQAVAAGILDSYVTLGSITANNARRLLDIHLTNAAPELDVRFRWKTNTPATPTHESAYCSLAFFCAYL